MALFLISFFVLFSVICLMAIGVIFGRKPIAGSCGGVGAALGEKNYVCELCGGDEAKCEEISLQASPSSTPFINVSTHLLQSNTPEK